MGAVSPWLEDDADGIRRALAVEGGHLAIGQGGYTLYYAEGSRLSGYDVEPMKAACIAAGLPVIDSRMLNFETAMHLVMRGPMVAVGKPADDPPWHCLADAPLSHVADLYRAAGAEVINFPCTDAAELSDPPPQPDGVAGQSAGQGRARR